MYIPKSMALEGPEALSLFAKKETRQTSWDWLDWAQHMRNTYPRNQADYVNFKLRAPMIAS